MDRKEALSKISELQAKNQTYKVETVDNSVYYVFPFICVGGDSFQLGVYYPFHSKETILVGGTHFLILSYKRNGSPNWLDANKTTFFDHQLLLHSNNIRRISTTIAEKELKIIDTLINKDRRAKLLFRSGKKIYLVDFAKGEFISDGNTVYQVHGIDKENAQCILSHTRKLRYNYMVGPLDKKERLPIVSLMVMKKTITRQANAWALLGELEENEKDKIFNLINSLALKHKNPWTQKK